MQEIKIKNNTLGLNVFIDSLPDISLIPSADLELLINDMEIEIYKSIEKKNKKLQKETKKVPP